MSEQDADLRERSIGELFSKLSHRDLDPDPPGDGAGPGRADREGQGGRQGRRASSAAPAPSGSSAPARITAGIILLLDLAIAAWLAAIVVGLVYVAVAAFLGLKGRDRIQAATPPVPEQTVDTVKEDVEWAKTRAQSAQR